MQKSGNAQSGERKINESEIEEMRGRINTLWIEEEQLIKQKEHINRRLREIAEEKMRIHITDEEGVK